MSEEYEILIEEIKSSPLDSDQLLKLMMVAELKSISRHLYNIDLTLMEVLKR